MYIYNGHEPGRLPSGTIKQKGAQIPQSLEFGYLDPHDLTEDDLQISSRGKASTTAQFLILSALGQKTLDWRTRFSTINTIVQKFKASKDLLKANDLQMQRELGAHTFTLMPDSGALKERVAAGRIFPMHCGYMPSQKPDEHKPTILYTLDSRNDVEAAKPFLLSLKAAGYPVLLYQRALLDEPDHHLDEPNPYHLGTAPISDLQFQTMMVDDLAYLSRQLEEGFPNAQIPELVRPNIKAESAENQFLIGHSAGALTTLFYLARPDTPTYRAALLVSPPLSFADAAYKTFAQETYWPLRRIPQNRASQVLKDLFDISQIFEKPSYSRALLQTPIAVAVGVKDGPAYEGAKEIYGNLRRIRPGQSGVLTAFAHMKGEDHHSVLDGGNSGQKPGERLATIADDLWAQTEPVLDGESRIDPERDLMRLDPRTSRYEGVVRFSGIA